MSPELQNVVSELAANTVMNEENYISEELANEIPPIDTMLWKAYEVQKALGVSKQSPVERFRRMGLNVTDDGATYYDGDFLADDYED